MGMDPSTMAMVGGALGGAILGMTQKGVQAPSQQPSPAPQPTQRPDSLNVLAQTQAQAAGTPGLASTFLTGPQGVDPKTVKTTRQSLYGS